MFSYDILNDTHSLLQYFPMILNMLFRIHRLNEFHLKTFKMQELMHMRLPCYLIENVSCGQDLLVHLFLASVLKDTFECQESPFACPAAAGGTEHHKQTMLH